MSDNIQQSILNKSRKDKFLLVLNLPDVLKQISKTDPGSRASNALNLDSLQYSVYGNIVPTIVVPDVDLAFAGQTVKATSYNRPPYEAITVSFKIDNYFNNWWVLWKWLNLINDARLGAIYNYEEIPDPNWRLSNSYVTNLTVFGLDEYNNKKIQFDYISAFITGLGGITYNYQDPDEIDSSFTFVFSQFDSHLL